jgi:lysine N6-hydroxylase
MKPNKTNIVGIGIGPSNLSLAALLQRIPNVTSVFLDKHKNFHWHRGMQLPTAKLQVSYLKDLVTLVDPQNPFSFLAFLSAQKRLYQFINANYQDVSRAEFSQYYRWVCNALSSNLKFDSEVEEVSLLKDEFLIKTSKMNWMTNSVVLGNGLTPQIPSFARNKLDKTLHHSSRFMDEKNDYKNKKIVIIGGGQSGAEIVAHMLSSEDNLPKHLTWITRRDNYLPLDDSPFVNELFTPVYSDYFYSLSQVAKNALVKKQKLFSDGISHDTIKQVYKLLYETRYIQGHKDLFSLVPEAEVLNITKENNQWNIALSNVYTKKTISIKADIVILCTGYQYELPAFLNPILNKINRDSDGKLIINKDFSLNCDLPENYKIYIQNGALHTRGVSDPNLSLASWRSATIINSIAKRLVYDITDYQSFFNWTASNDETAPSIIERVV